MFSELKSDIILSKSFPKLQKLTCFLTIMIVIVIMLICLMSYQSYDTLMGTVVYQDGKYNVLLPISLTDLRYYHNDDYLIIDNQKYPYQIVNIDTNLLINDKLENYQMVTLMIDLPREYQINNYCLLVKKNKEKKKLFHYLLGND